MVEYRFSVEDAMEAGLWLRHKTEDEWKKELKSEAWRVFKSPWWTYSKRMLLARARGFLLKDHFDEYTRGTPMLEELADMDRAEREINAMSEPVKPEKRSSLFKDPESAEDAVTEAREPDEVLPPDESSPPSSDAPEGNTQPSQGPSVDDVEELGLPLGEGEPCPECGSTEGCKCPT